MIGKRVTGKRVTGKRPHDLEPGEYVALTNNDTGKATWYACTPNGLVGNLDGHDVTEHEDGTITVSPSILVRQGAQGAEYHGFLKRGVWSES